MSLEITDRQKKIKKSLPQFSFCSVKERDFCSGCEVNSFRKSQTQEVMTLTWWGINIDSTVKSPWKEDTDLRFVGPEKNRLLWSVQTANRNRYRQPLINLIDDLLRKRLKWNTRLERVILRHDDAPCRRTPIIQSTNRMLKWDLLLNLPYSPDLNPPDFHIFRSKAHRLASLQTTWNIALL